MVCTWQPVTSSAQECCLSAAARGGEQCLCLCKNLIATLPASPRHLRVGYLADGKRGRKRKGRIQKLSQLYLSTNTCAVMEVKCMCSVKLGNTMFGDNVEFYLCPV